jgi:hypothetical protein
MHVLLTGLVEEFAGHALWHGFTASVRRLLGREIRITSPRPDEVLSNPQPFSSGVSYEVKGTLKHLPKNHQIWLLVQAEKSPRIWPQGFERVVYNPDSKSWVGRIKPMSGGPNVTIIAAVAPRTSQEFFQYYEKVGPKTSYEPLERVPAECRNIHEVQAKKP